MRVAHIITRFIVGGAQENTLYNVGDLVRNHGDEVILLTGPETGPEGDLLGIAHQQNLDVRIVSRLCRAIAPWNDWNAYRHLYKMLKTLQPDVVHTHSSKAGILGRAAAAAARVPAIVHTIHGLPFHPYQSWWKNRLYISAERWAARRCHRIIVVANAMTEQAVAAGIAPPEKFVTVYSGMDVEPFFQPTRPVAEMRRELGIDQNAVVVAKVARLFELKGHDDVIDAAVPLVRQYPNLRFLFVGGGLWRERLQTKIDNLGLTPYFVFTGLVPPNKVPDLIAMADMVVHASLREGLARVLPQALLAGKPVVAYDVDGAREVVLPARTGYLVPARDVAGLTNALARLISDPALGQQMGNTGRALFADQFRHETMTARIRAIYEEILFGSA